jgi:hypothetical protein
MKAIETDQTKDQASKDRFINSVERVTRVKKLARLKENYELTQINEIQNQSKDVENGENELSILNYNKISDTLFDSTYHKSQLIERKSRRCIIPRKWMISSKSKFKQIWDFLIVTLAIFNSIIVPIDIAFHPKLSIAAEVINQATDFFFLLDIIFQFITSFTNNRGKEVWESQEIANNYMHSLLFFTDVLSMFGTHPFVRMD